MARRKRRLTRDLRAAIAERERCVHLWNQAGYLFYVQHIDHLLDQWPLTEEAVA